jgi:sulfur carrier protein
MRVRLNGEDYESRGGITVASLLRELELGAGRVAVALNGEVVARSKYETRKLREGDEIEVIHAVAGG